MRKIVIALAMSLLASNASAQITLYEEKGSFRLYTTGEVTARTEHWNWFDPAGSAADNNYSYQFIRSRLALGFETETLDVFVQGQHTRMWNLPNDAMAPAPGGALGLGAIYYAHNRDSNPYSTFINQAYVRLKDIGGTGLYIKAGRFEYVDGLEVTYANPKVMWLKNMRLSERMIGPFGWSAFTRSFDGAELALDREKYNITFMASRPTQGGFDRNAHASIDDIWITASTFTLKYNTVIPNTEARLFHFYYDDERNIAKPDNTPPGSGLNDGRIKIHTLGFHVLNTVDAGPGTADFLLWGAGQAGDWGRQDHRAWAFTAETGYQFTGLFLKPWLRAGYFVSSGDSNPTDGDHETFFQMLPTARKYAFFPFYNLMNNEDFFLQLVLRPHEKVIVRSDLHFLRVNESDDRWYMGAGATKERGNIFGYIARPTGGSASLAKILDLTTIVNFNKYVFCMAYYAHAWGGDIIRNVYGSRDEADLFFLELTLRF
ncbi:MAG: hypothetical protein FJ119_08805 [Deltaproteobacteria bacterium]|nr:hypothetical protein [Deltaproteobacteria bacterium]